LKKANPQERESCKGLFGHPGERSLKLSPAKGSRTSTLVAAGAAYAQPPRYHAAPEVYDTQGNPRYGFGPRVTAQPGDVISGNRQIGRDPDPFIRDQMLREYNSGRFE
jgi:hypothetical protein